MVDGECRVLREQCSLGAGNPRASAEARSASLSFSGRRLWHDFCLTRRLAGKGYPSALQAMVV